MLVILILLVYTSNPNSILLQAMFIRREYKDKYLQAHGVRFIYKWTEADISKRNLIKYFII